MKIIVGLGNPGPRYAETRHNIGWLVLDAIAERLRTEFQPGRGDYFEAPASWRGKKVVLVKPTTWMNNSGLAVKQVARVYGVSPEDILVVVDEIQFPVGQFKLKSSGSSGGHNGVESILYHLEEERFPRLRCGVGNDFGPGELVEYVLSGFTSEEQEALARMIEEAKDGALLWIAQGTARAMNLLNSRKQKSAAKADDDPEKSQRQTIAPSSEEGEHNGKDLSTNS